LNEDEKFPNHSIKLDELAREISENIGWVGTWKFLQNPEPQFTDRVAAAFVSGYTKGISAHPGPLLLVGFISGDVWKMRDFLKKWRNEEFVKNNIFFAEMFLIS
jgi:hypothetical protein